MKQFFYFIITILFLILTSCMTKNKKESAIDTVTGKTRVAGPTTEIMDRADTLMLQTIAAHGGDRYDSAHFRFKFRDKVFTFHNKNEGFTYTSTGQKDGEVIRDSLINGTLIRNVDGTETELSSKDIAKYTEALNSVVYFATLPHKLKDAAVKRSYAGRTAIKGKDYDMLAVTFEEEGGGTDYQDKFLYWINSNTKTVDYLAYSYETNDGGVRFRSAYNPREVGGIRFQDYVNYEAPIGTPLNELPKLYEAGELKELSRIETENVEAIEE